MKLLKRLQDVLSLFVLCIWTRSALLSVSVVPEAHHQGRTSSHHVDNCCERSIKCLFLNVSIPTLTTAVSL